VTTLMIYAGSSEEDSPGLRTGGLPLVPEGFTWPVCRSCTGSMQFVAQLDAGLAIFLCQNEPGLCDEWEADSGANLAVVLPPGGRPAVPPPTGVTRLGAVAAARLVEVPGAYDEARSAWPGGGRAVLGQLGGAPGWLQDDDTPDCCGAPMTFRAQLEVGPDYATEINFGGGCGYAFTCARCAKAAFLFQN
jgi:hypothetical protein